MSHEHFYRLLGQLATALVELYAIQPYHSPGISRMWRAIAKICQKLAYWLGWAGLKAEYNYIQAVNSGT